jgi:hypothetical protein
MRRGSARMFLGRSTLRPELDAPPRPRASELPCQVEKFAPGVRALACFTPQNQRRS